MRYRDAVGEYRLSHTGRGKEKESAIHLQTLQVLVSSDH
jgi:hypothetical protein